jgi:hypothetical protein
MTSTPRRRYATLCLRENPGCIFIATNTDAVTHLTDAQEWAGNGSMVRASLPTPHATNLPARASTRERGGPAMDTRESCSDAIRPTLPMQSNQQDV